MTASKIESHALFQIFYLSIYLKVLSETCYITLLLLKVIYYCYILVRSVVPQHWLFRRIAAKLQKCFGDFESSPTLHQLDSEQIKRDIFIFAWTYPLTPLSSLAVGPVGELFDERETRFPPQVFLCFSSGTRDMSYLSALSPLTSSFIHLLKSVHRKGI